MSKNQSNVKELNYIVDDSVLTSHVKELMLSQQFWFSLFNFSAVLF